MEKVGQIINKSINAILLDEVDETFDAENYSDIDPSLQQDKVKKFYMAAAGASVVVVLLFVFWNSITDMVKVAVG